MREITSYWFDVLREVIGSTCKSAPISNSYFVLRADSLTVILSYVQIPSQLFDLRAVCRGNNELFLVPIILYYRNQARNN